MSAPFTEDTVEQAALDWLRELGYGAASARTSPPVNPPLHPLLPKLISGEVRVGDIEGIVAESE